MTISHMSKSSRIAPLVVALGMILASEAEATVTDIQWTPVVPVMGEAVTYFPRVEVPFVNVQTYKWKYKSVQGCGDWISDPTYNSEFITFNETRPGTWKIRLTVTYAGSSGMPIPPPPTVIEKDVTIASATHAVIVQGKDSPQLLEYQIHMRFRLMSGLTRDCGTFLGGLAQELIVDKELLSPPLFPPHPPDDTEWTPSGPVDVFKLEGNEIRDMKGHGPGFNWNAIPIGVEYHKVTQKLRYLYVDTCGVTQEISLGSFRLARIRTDLTHWNIVEH